MSQQPCFANLDSRQCVVALRILNDLENGPSTTKRLLKPCAATSKEINSLLCKELLLAGCVMRSSSPDFPNAPLWTKRPQHTATAFRLLHERLETLNKRQEAKKEK